jgi:large conductance mechanosensitive channel
MKFIKEFKEFSIKGNMVDLAVGIIVGTSFNKIISSIVGDIFFPTIGLVTGGLNFKDLHYTSTPLTGGNPININYGIFLQNSVEFLITALTVFIIVKLMIRLHLKKQPEPLPPPTPPRTEVLLAEIKDILKQKTTS